MPALRRVGLSLTLAVIACIPAGRSDEPRPSPPATIQRQAPVALDRITKRRAELNGKARHRGDGRGVTVYVFDGGIDTATAELRGRVRPGFNAYDDGARFCNPHGTAVAGAIAGTTVGVASAASIVDVKVIDCRTLRGTIGALRAAALWTIEDHANHPGPAIANWSLLIDSTSAVPPIDSVIQALHADGILVIVSAGNVDRDACGMSPANARRTLVVGAASLVPNGDGRLRDVRTRGTAWGDCIDLYAPGDSVLLPDPGGGHSFRLWRGTSMAAGYVSGAAAILLERHPGARPDSVMAMLRRSATADVVEENVASRQGRRRRLLYIGGGGPDQ